MQTQGILRINPDARRVLIEVEQAYDVDSPGQLLLIEWMLLTGMEEISREAPCSDATARRVLISLATFAHGLPREVQGEVLVHLCSATPAFNNARVSPPPCCLLDHSPVRIARVGVNCQVAGCVHHTSCSRHTIVAGRLAGCVLGRRNTLSLRLRIEIVEGVVPFGVGWPGQLSGRRRQLLWRRGCREGRRCGTTTAAQRAAALDRFSCSCCGTCIAR